MDSKFYVSYEAARLLKEKGYDEECDCVIDDDGDIFEHQYQMNQDLPEWKCSCPTKAEAIDWLESKGILIATSFTYNRKWFCTIKSLVRDEMVSTLDLPTRLEAEEAAIIKALKLLNGKEE